MSPDDSAYVADLIRTARWLYADAVALLNEAARIVGGEPRDAPGKNYKPRSPKGVT